MKSPRDIAEVAKALVQLRSLCSDTAFKRHQIRKNLSDIVYRSGDNDNDNENLIKETARIIINELHGNYLKEAPKQINTTTNDEVKKLDDTVKKYISRGDIQLSTNDKLIGLNNHIQYKYDRKNDEFIAVDERNGRIVQNFPKERLPDVKVVRVTKDEIITATGDSYELYGE
jgi:hypothetical protein